MSGRLDEVDTSMDPVIDELGSIDSVLLFKVGVEAGFDIVDDRFPSVVEQQNIKSVSGS